MKITLPEHWKLQQVARSSLPPAGADWPDRLAVQLMAWNQQGYEVAPEDLEGYENWIAAWATAPSKKYPSQKVVVPERIISAIASMASTTLVGVWT
jgi:hypothetical protein